MTTILPERTRYIGDEDDLQIWWFRNGQLINFSSGYAFTLKVANHKTRDPIIFTKTTGFAGAAGSGEEGNGVPNLVVSWNTLGELNSIESEGRYVLEIVARTTAGAETTLEMTLFMRARLG